MPPIQVIAGLGNPDSRYQRTRHNLGFMVVDALAEAWRVSLSPQRRFQAELGEALLGGRKVLLVKPLTYMNRSGESLRALVDWYKLSPAGVLVVYDDLDLPLARVRLRPAGSAGGHNGMKSIISHLGTTDFPRLRLGIGKGGDAAEYVLSPFSPSEWSSVKDLLPQMVSLVETCICEGIDKTMNIYNRPGETLQ